MDTRQSENTDSQFISFHDDFPPTVHIGNAEGQLDTGASVTHQPFNNLSNDSTGLGIIEDLQGIDDSKSQGTVQHNFWTIEYYQKFFNVDTNDVVGRLKRSVIPYGSDNYLLTHIRPNPDLYGPFWICMTLIFSVAVSKNIADYLQTVDLPIRLPNYVPTKYHWRYDFHVVSYAATFIFLYAWLLPLALWGALQWTNNSKNTEEELIEAYAVPGLLELLCLYGYSLTIYIPVVFLWTIQIGWLQWTLVIVSTILSGGVLLRSLLPVIAGKHRIIYVTVILSMHLLLAAGFMLYFYHVPFRSTVSTVPELVASSTRTSMLDKLTEKNNTNNVAAKS